MPQVSCSTETGAEESAPLPANSLLVTLKVSRAGHSKQLKKPKDAQVTQINEQEAVSVALPDILSGSELHLPGLPWEEFSKIHRLGKAVESHTTSTSGGKETSKDTQRDKELLVERDTDVSASDSSPYMAGVSYTASPWVTATGLPNVSMGQYYSNQSTVSTFSTVPDSAYASNEPYDPGYHIQLIEPSEESTDTTFTRPTPVTLGWMPDTWLVKMYTFLAPKGQEPYFKLRHEYKETPETPQRVYLDPHQ